MRLLNTLRKIGVLIPSAPVCALGQLPLVSKGSLWETDCHTSVATLVRNDIVSFRLFSIDSPEAGRKILTFFRRCGRGVLRGAAFRQRPLSRLLINVLAGTRTLPPEEPAPKRLWSVGIYGQALTSRRFPFVEILQKIAKNFSHFALATIGRILYNQES